MEIVAQNKMIDPKLVFKYFPHIKVPNPQNNPSDIGINITVMGIKFLKDSSNCKELDIQDVPVKKKPTPKKYPT